MELTDNEKELILAIRNYKKSYPNGHPNLLFYAQQLFDELIDVNIEFWTQPPSQKEGANNFVIWLQ